MNHKQPTERNKCVSDKRHVIIYLHAKVTYALKQRPFLPPACVVRREGNVFTGVSQSVHPGGVGEGVPESQVLSQVSGPRFFPRSLVPGPFWGGGTPVLIGGGGGTPVLAGKVHQSQLGRVPQERGNSQPG